MAQELHAIHARHVEVHQHQVRRARCGLQQVQCGLGIRRTRDLRLRNANLGKQADGHPALEAVVLQDQYVQFSDCHPLPRAE